MGQALVAALSADSSFQYVGGFGRADVAGSGRITRSAALGSADVILDFTSASAATELAVSCAERGGPALVIGATGFSPSELDQLHHAAARIPIVRAGNFSIGVNLLMGLVAAAGSALPAADWDIEIVEAHHRAKVDAPSGTALMLGEAAAQGRGVALDAVARESRAGMTGERPAGEIGFAVVRAGGIVGEHKVMFASGDEILTLSHMALDRTMFARGALVAARWVAGQRPGHYDMQDVLKPSQHP